MKMLNNYLAGKDITNDKTKSESGFEDTKKLDFKTLMILSSSEPDVVKGDKVRVRSSAGHVDEIEGEEVTIIHRGDIIRIL